MTIGSILLGLALLIAVALILARPFLARSQRERNRLTPHELLTEQKEAVLTQIRALDFDYETSKVPDEVYHLQREQLMTKATTILKMLDELESDAPVIAAQTPATENDEIEAAIARARQVRKTAVSNTAVPTNGHPRFCPKCGHSIDKGDKFCTACGHKLIPIKK